MRIVLLFFLLLYCSSSYAMYYEMELEECLMMAQNEEGQLLCYNIDEQRKKYPQSEIRPKYMSDGHLYTTFTVLSIAGLKDDELYDLAYCSQLPDDEAGFSATLGFFYFFKPKYRKQIMETLHSLHGGREEAVLSRRKGLKQIIKQAYFERSLPNCGIGIAIHAYADSYSHTYKRDDELRAYGGIVGHLLHGVFPDIIAYYPDKFKDYVLNLYSIFKGNKNDQKMKEFLSFISMLPNDRSLAVDLMSSYAVEQGYEETKMEKYKKIWQKKIGKKEMKEFISRLENKGWLNNPDK